MKQTAVVVAPGRGTYNKAELGYLKTHHPSSTLLAKFDGYRLQNGQSTISELDGAEKFTTATHLRGDNASPLIYTCGLSDFGSIDRSRFDIVGVTGNSMGWYTALACAGALDPFGGFTVANTMGTLMHEHIIGGQLIYPLVDENWCEVPGHRAWLLGEISAINSKPGHFLGLSIDLGGMFVLAGSEAGLAAFELAIPAIQGRYPMRLPGHAGFHTHLQLPVSKLGFDAIPSNIFKQPALPLIDGRGAIWHPHSSNPDQLYDYTLGHQVTEFFDLSAAIRTAAQELMPDVIIVLGPGNTLGGATAQALIKCQWRAWTNKSDFQTSAKSSPRLLSMGTADGRRRVTTM